MGTEELSAVVETPRVEAAVASLRAEGVYDDERSVTVLDDETSAVPVTEPPAHTAVLDVVRAPGEPRLRTLTDHLRERGWTDEELAEAPHSWAVVGRVILVRLGDAPRPAEVGEALLALHGGADTVLAREGISGPHREPSVRVIAGDGDTETVHHEHGTAYALDLAEVMFSPGNKAERTRMGEIVTGSERVLDAFAGIGYFALPMASAGATVTAVERNPTAFRYLLENAQLNDVADRLSAYRGDNRDIVPTLAADGLTVDRAVLGHYDAWESLDAVLPALGSGGTIHLHEATPDALVPDRPLDRLNRATDAADRSVVEWDARRVKGHSEGVAHVVIDAQID